MTRTELILQECRKLEKKINEDFLNDFVKLHNIDPKYSTMHAKQELVISRILFPGPKKQYSMKISNTEGVEVNERAEKGLCTRRSDYGETTKLKVAELLDLIMMSDKISFTVIREFIDKTTKYFLSEIVKRTKELSKPVSVTKSFKSYKTGSQNATAARLWNDLEYEYFSAGTKGYLFKIKGIDLFKAPDIVREKYQKLKGYKNLNAIAIPYEEEFLPNYYNLNIEATLKFAWTDRVDGIIRPFESQVYKKEDNFNDQDLVIEF